MAEKSLDIQIRLDVSDVKAAAAVAEAELRKATAAAERLAFDREQAEEKASERVIELARREARAKESEAAKAAKAQVAEAAKAAAAQDEAFARGMAKAESFGTTVRHAAAQFLGFQGAQAIVSAVGGAFQAARDRSRELADQVLQTRDALREIAAIKDVRSDTKLALEDARFQQATGLRPDESIAFQARFLGAGEQFIGKNITRAEADEFARMAGGLAAARGLGAEEVGDLGGSLLGFSDFNRFGGKAGEEAAGRLGRGIGILARGKGDTSVLVKQASMLAASALNEDEMKGVFTTTEEVMTAISTAAEKRDTEAFEISRTAIRALSDFDGEQGETLRAAGITPEDRFFDRVAKMARHLDTEAVAKGQKPADYLREHGFERMEDRESVLTFAHRGIGGGVISDRLNYAKSMGGGDEVQAEIDRFLSDPEGPGSVRAAEAGLRAAELQAGADKANQEALRKQALARLTDRGEIDTTWANIEEGFFDWTSPAIWTKASPGFREEKVDAEQQAILRERALAAGIHPDNIRGVSDNFGVFMAGSEEAQTARIKSMMAGLEGAGVNPITGAAAGPAPAGMDRSPVTGQSAAEMIELLRRINGNLEHPPERPPPIPIEARGGRPDRAR